MPLIRRAAPGQLLPAPTPPRSPPSAAALHPGESPTRRGRGGRGANFQGDGICFLLIFGAFLIATIGLVVFMLAIPLLQGRG